MDRISTLSGKGEKITPEVAQQVVDEVKAETPTGNKATPGFQPLKTPAEAHADYARSQGYEPYVHNDQLPTIEAGSTPKSDLPTIQTEAPTKAPPGLTYEPVKATVSDVVPKTAPEVTQSTPTVSELADKATAPVTPTPIEGTPAQSPLALSIAKELNQKTDGVAGYTPTTNAEQARIFAEKVVPQGRDVIKGMIEGKIPLPEGQKSFPFVVAAEKYLKANPDHELAYALQNSPHVSASSEFASNLGAGNNRDANSFVERAKSIGKARETRIGEKKMAAAKKIPAAAAKEMNKINLSAEDLGKLESFIDKITC